MADPAVISVVTTGTVGVLGATLGALNPWFTRKNQVEERLEARRNDFRAVLDEAASVLAVAVGHVEQIWLIISSQEGGPSGTVSLGDDIADVRAHSARLGVRLGPWEPTYAGYNRALAGLVELEAHRARWYAGSFDASSAWDERRDFVARISTCRRQIIESYATFQESARWWMGVPTR